MLVVGGSSGIAVEIARQAVAAGAQVTVPGRYLDRTRAATQPLGRAVTAATVDLSDEATIHALADELGEVDHVVNLASIPAIGAVQDPALGRINQVVRLILRPVKDAYVRQAR